MRCRKSNGQFTKCRKGSRVASLRGLGALRAERIEYVLTDTTNVYWPEALPYRSTSTPNGKGYASEKAARVRAAQVERHYARRHGRGGPVLRIVTRAVFHR